MEESPVAVSTQEFARITQCARTVARVRHQRLSLMTTIWSLWRSGATRCLRPDRPALSRIRPAQGLFVLPVGRRLRRPDPGRPRRPLQGRSRLPHRPRVELPQLRGALHHPPDHHRGEDRDPQQALPAEPVRLVLQSPAAAGDGEPTLEEILPGPTAHDPVNQVISTEELRSLVACLTSVLSELESERPGPVSRRLLLRGDRRAARVRHEDGRQRPAARQAQGRDPSRPAGDPSLAGAL